MVETTRTLIGKQIRTLREKKGLTLNQLALMIGTERSYLGKIETGRVNTSIDKLERIAKGLDMTLFDFFYTFRDK